MPVKQGHKFRTETPLPESLSHIVEGFTLSLRAQNKRPNTIKSYLEAIRLLAAYLAERGMPLSVEGIAREHIEAFLSDLAQRPARRGGGLQSAATVANRYRSLKVFFNWCVEDDEIERSPMERMKAPRVPERATPVITVEEIRKMLSICERDRTFYGKRDSAIIRILVDTGLRRAEVGNLTMDDIIKRDSDWFLRVTVKGGDQAESRLGYKAARALYKYLNARASFSHAGSRALWLGASGKMTPRGIAWVLQKRATEAGLSDVRPHRFRFTFVHMALEAGMSESDVQQLGHWKNAAMVRHYGKALANERAFEAHRRYSPGDEV